MLKHLKMIPCCVTPQQHEALKALSKRAGVSMQRYLREAVADLLGKHDGGTPPAGDAGYITANDLSAAQKVFDSNADPVWGKWNSRVDPSTAAEFKRQYAHHVGPDSLIDLQNEPGMTPECARAYAIFSKLQEAWKAGVNWKPDTCAVDQEAAMAKQRKRPKASYITDAASPEVGSSYITEPPKPKGKEKRKSKAKPILTAEQIAAFDEVWYEPADIRDFSARSKKIAPMRAAGWRPPHERERSERRAQHGTDAAKAARKKKATDKDLSRRRRLKELHPDKMEGRDQTPAERAEFTKLAKKGKRRKR